MATTTENLGLTLPAGTDKADISVLNENFQALDDFAGQATANIQEAKETADAAAPQSTTYTKTEVDAALAAKLNTADVDDALSETSINPVQNKAVQAPIARLVDDGAKNIFDPTVIPQTATKNGVTITRTEKGIHVSGTVTATADTAIANNMGLVIPSDGYRVYINAASSDLTVWMEYKVNGSSVYAPATRDVLNSGYVLNYLYFKNLPGGASFDVDVDIMICTDEDYAVSPDFVPYAKSNYELTQSVEPIPRLVDAGAKNLLDIETALASSTPYHATYSLTDGALSIAANGPYARLSVPFLYRKGTMTFSCNVSDLVISGGNVAMRFARNADSSDSLADPIVISKNGIVTKQVAVGNDTQGYVIFYINTGNTSNQNSADFSDIMICTAEDYAISPEFVPYAPSNRELFESKADNSIVGLKLVAHSTMGSSSPFTYEMNKKDFVETSPDQNRSIGTYIISIMPWSITPEYSLYAVSYTGGTFQYTSTVKIAGKDRQITVENGVISVSGLPSSGGKISIHALL